MEDDKKLIEPAAEDESAADASAAEPVAQVPCDASAEDDTPVLKPLDEVPAPASDIDSSSEDMSAKACAIDEMEKATQKALDAMREQDNPQNEEVVDNAEKSLDELFEEFSKWMKDNTQPEKIRAEMKIVQDKVNDLLEKTRIKVIEVSNNEKFKSTMESGKDFVIGTAGLIGDGLKYGYDKLLEIPEFKKVTDAIGAKVDEMRHNENLQNAVNRGEEHLSQFNSALFDNIRSFFRPADEMPSEDKDEILPDLPEDIDPHTGA